MSRKYSKDEDCIFPWIVNDPDPEKLLKFSFVDNDNKHTIRMMPLYGSDPAKIAEHAGSYLQEMSAVGDLDDTSLYFSTLKRTLRGPLPTTFQAVYDALPTGTDLNLETLTNTVKGFIGTYDDGTTLDDALSQLRNGRTRVSCVNPDTRYSIFDTVLNTSTMS